MNGLEIRLARRNVFRQGLRSFMPLAVVATACLVIVLIGGIYEFMFQSLQRSAIRNDGHLTIASAEGTIGLLTADRLDRIRALPGVALAAPRATLSGLVGFGEHGSVFSGRMVDPELERLMQAWPDRPAALAANLANAGNPQAKIGVLLAQGLQAAPGDQLNGLAGDKGFSATIQELVRTDAEESDRFFLELPFSATGAMSWKLVDSLHIQLRPGTDPAQVAPAIQAIFRADKLPAPVLTSFADPVGYLNSVKTIYANNLLFIMIVLSLTVFLAIAAAFTMAITERTAELGTIRSFGAPDRHITSLFQLEALFASLIGFAIGLALALVVAAIINGLGGIWMPPPPTVKSASRVGFVFHPWYAFLALLIVVGVGQLSAFVVTRRLGRLSIIQQLGLNN